MPCALWMCKYLSQKQHRSLSKNVWESLLRSTTWIHWLPYSLQRIASSEGFTRSEECSENVEENARNGNNSWAECLLRPDQIFLWREDMYACISSIGSHAHERTPTWDGDKIESGVALAWQSCQLKDWWTCTKLIAATWQRYKRITISFKFS